MSAEAPEEPPLLPRNEAGVVPRPWGAWATIGWTAVIMVAAVVAQLLVGVIFVVVTVARGQKIDPEKFGSDGDFLAVATAASGVVAFGLSVLFAGLRKGIELKRYLALRLPTGREFIRWTGLLLAVALASDVTTTLLGRPLVPDVMVELYKSASWALPALWFVLLIAAPLSEEFLFRGFLFAGLERSTLGRFGTILLTAALWAAIHTQYDLYGVMTIFVGGLLLGFARAKTGSLWLCVFLHGIMNLIATIQVLYMTR